MLRRKSMPRRRARTPCLPTPRGPNPARRRSEEHTSELQSLTHLVCRLLLEKKKKGVEAAANESETVEHAVRIYFERVCAHTGWTVGHGYAVARIRTDEIVLNNI